MQSAACLHFRVVFELLPSNVVMTQSDYQNILFCV